MVRKSPLLFLDEGQGMPISTPRTIAASFLSLRRETMTTIAELLAAEHRDCDEAFTVAEDGVHLELAKNPTILYNLLNNKVLDSQIPCG